MFIILFSSWVNKNNTILGFYQHRVNKGNVSCTSPSFLFLSGDPMPSGIIGGGEMEGWVGVSKRPVLQLIKGEILQVAGCLSQE